MSDTARLATFIQGAIAGDDLPGPLQKLVVCHIIKGNKIGDQLRMVRAPASISDDWISETSLKIVTMASEEAKTLGAGVQRYAVQAFFAGDDQPLQRHVFTCAGNAQGDELGAIGTEGPDTTGLVAQSMRHTEFYAALSFKSQERREEKLIQENETLRRELEQMRAQRVKDWAALEEVYGKQEERQIARAALQLKTKIWEQAWEKLSLLVPTALNHAAGKTIFPEDVTSKLLLKAFVESITKEDFQKWATALKPEQLASFMQLAQSVSAPAPEPGGSSPDDLSSKLAVIANGAGLH